MQVSAYLAETLFQNREQEPTTYTFRSLCRIEPLVTSTDDRQQPSAAGRWPREAASKPPFGGCGRLCRVPIFDEMGESERAVLSFVTFNQRSVVQAFPIIEPSS